MAIKHLVTHTENDPGETGTASLGKIIGIVLGIVTVYFSVAFFGFGPELPTPLTFWQYIIGTGAMIVLSAGAYKGMGAKIFTPLMEAIVSRIRGSKG